MSDVQTDLLFLQSSFMFVTTERLKQITENLGTQNTLEVSSEYFSRPISYILSHTYS